MIVRLQHHFLELEIDTFAEDTYLRESHAREARKKITNPHPLFFERIVTEKVEDDNKIITKVRSLKIRLHVLPRIQFPIGFIFKFN
jgi:hypothetical protein